MEQKGRSIWPALLVAVFLVVPLSGVSQARVGGANQLARQRSEYEYLGQRAREDGTVRVIVGLDLPAGFRPEGDLVDAVAIQAQRSAISTMQQKLFDRLSRHNVDSYAVYSAIPYVALSVDSSGMEALLALPFVRSVQEDTLMRTTLLSSTSVIGAPNVWAAGFDGAGQAVVILDTGIDANHPFFGGRVAHEACFSNAGGSGGWVSLCPNGMPTQSGTGAADATATQCWNGGQGTQLCDHGSHVAGIVAGSDYGGGPGYSGVAPGADIIAIQVFTRFDDSDFCAPDASCVASYTSDQIAALDYVYSTLYYSYTIASINMSLGGGHYTDQTTCDSESSATKAAIDNLRSVGIATAIASGNAYWTDALEAPGCISSAVGVGATMDLDGVASFSNMHDMVDLLAPGVSIDSSIPDNTYATYQGTSMATPHVAGAWAILKSIDPLATVDDVLTALQSTGVNVTDRRPGGNVTKPRIQLDAAVLSMNSVNLWEGSVNGSWSNSGNWSRGVVPGCLSNVQIPAGVGFSPDIDADASVGNLTMETGTQLDMGANILNVCGDWDIGGTGVFSATGGLVVLRGSTDQTVTMLAGLNGQFFNLRVGAGDTSQTVVINGDLDIDGSVEITGSASLQAGTNTIYVAGDWTDSVDGFVADTTTVVFDGSGQVAEKLGTSVIVAYQNDFSALAGWTIYDTDANPWYVSTTADPPNSPYSGQHGRYYGLRFRAANDWLFSPEFALEAGKVYTIAFSYGANPGVRAESLAVYIGSLNSPAAMTTQVFDDGSITNTSWQQGSEVFVPSSTGTYYVGFHATTRRNGGELAVDDLVVSRAGDTRLTFYDLIIDGSAMFAGDVIVQNDLTVSAGSVMDIGMNNLAVEGTLANSGGLRQSRDAPNTTLTPFLHILDAGGTITKHYGVDIYPTSGNMGSTMVTVYGNQACSSGSGAVQRCFEISPATPQAADITFYYRDAEKNGQDAALVWHWGGSAWEQQAFGGRGRTGVESNWVQATGVTSYSPFALGNDIPTAVRLVSLRAVPDGDGILVTWETATELDNLGFNLYRSQSVDSQYAKINEALIPSQSPGATLGAVYAWRDRDIRPGVAYYYMLEDVDINGVRTIHGPLQAALALHDGLIYLPIVSKGY